MTITTEERARRPAAGGIAAEVKRLLIVDDHWAVRSGLQELLEDQLDFFVLSAASTAEEAVSLAERETVDVAVVEFQLPDRNGLWVSRKLKCLPTPPRVLLYSAYSDALLVAAAVTAGADAILSRGRLGSELCAAIRKVARGQLLVPRLSGPVAESLRRRLDDEQQAILGMSLAGISTGEIASIMGISRAGLEARRSELLSKLETLDPH